MADRQLQSQEWDVGYSAARTRLAALLSMSADLFDWWPEQERHLLRDSAKDVEGLQQRDPRQTWDCFVGPRGHGERMHYWLLPVEEAAGRGIKHDP